MGNPLVKCGKMLAAGCALALAATAAAGPDADKIAATGVKVFKQAKCQGFDWIIHHFPTSYFCFGRVLFSMKLPTKALAAVPQRLPSLASFKRSMRSMGL